MTCRYLIADLSTECPGTVEGSATRVYIHADLTKRSLTMTFLVVITYTPYTIYRADLRLVWFIGD